MFYEKIRVNCKIIIQTVESLPHSCNKPLTSIEFSFSFSYSFRSRFGSFRFYGRDFFFSYYKSIFPPQSVSLQSRIRSY